ncbi:MAG: nicotinate-nucleotide--dimethylbenzimidazole phosphoribosyltransferase [Peptococcaceae bacterium]|jgi:nicotinate-nucleotide--dimethylbenzimidazole phosphoribosyltransferase|nr:nicotinate-nucleotide--dimethylbenzimidazole phosphoribosyltransferase [Peptococcaceae bacterium]
MRLLNKVINGISPVYKEVAVETQRHIDNLLKPIGSLGRLEDIAARISSITGKVSNKLDKKCVVVFASDNGICEEGVSGAPASVTITQFLNMTKGLTGINVFSSQAGSDVILVDVGVNGDLPYDQIVNKKIRRGTRNMLKEAAMTRQEAVQALETGIDMVRELVAQNYMVIGTGEMGIGNTSTSATVIMSLTGRSAEEVVGKGVGMLEPDYQHKKEVLKEVIKRRQPNPKDPIDVLSQVGGYDIGAIAGVFLGCAYYKIPTVIDGVISVAGALLAARLNPLCVQYMFPSHLSAEPGYAIAIQELGLTPYFILDMRLGEGTGCPFAFYLMDNAMAIIREMGTFEQGNIDGSILVDTR